MACNDEDSATTAPVMILPFDVSLVVLPLFQNTCPLCLLMDFPTFPHGGFAAVARSMGMHTQMVQQLWKHAHPTLLNHGQSLGAIQSQKNNCGHNTIYNVQNLEEAMMKVPLGEHIHLHSLANALLVPLTTVHWFIMKDDIAFHHSSALKATISQGDSEVGESGFHLKSNWSKWILQQHLQPSSCG